MDDKFYEDLSRLINGAFDATFGRNITPTEKEKPMVTIKNEELIRQYAPAAFATEPEEGRVSGRYSFLPTTEILSILQDEGWTAWKAQQVNGSQVEQGPRQAHYSSQARRHGHGQVRCR